MKRYALLDTDFISKTYSVQDDGGNHLIDRVMELPEYEFFCHAQIVTELNRYNADAPIWLSEKIGAQKIKSYTDLLPSNEGCSALLSLHFLQKFGEVCRGHNWNPAHGQRYTSVGQQADS